MGHNLLAMATPQTAFLLIFSIVLTTAHGISVGDDVRYDLEGTGVGDYQLAFRATAGNRKSVYEAYTTKVQPGVNEWSCCKQMLNTSLCRDHYRNSQILDNWNNIEKVALVLYNRGVRVKQLFFNGDGSTYLSWLSRDRLMIDPNSTLDWNDLRSEESNYFSIRGDSRAKASFFLSRSYSGNCAYNRGWMMVSEKESPSCYYESRYEYYPRFIYIAGDTQDTWWDGPRQTADVMAIFVKKYSTAQCHL